MENENGNLRMENGGRKSFLFVVVQAHQVFRNKEENFNLIHWVSFVSNTKP